MTTTRPLPRVPTEAEVAAFIDARTTLLRLCEEQGIRFKLRFRYSDGCTEEIRSRDP